MPKIDTGQARTDLYGQGKGEAQVFGNQDVMARENRKARLDFAKGQQATRAKAKKQKDLFDIVSKAGGKGVKPGDMKYFQESSQGLYDMVLKAVGTDGSIDNASFLRIQQAANQLTGEAEMSKNQREALEATLSSHDDTLDYAEEAEEATRLYNTQGEWGKNIQNVKRLDVNKFTKDILESEAKAAVDTGEIGTREFTAEDASASLDRIWEANPILQDNFLRQSKAATVEEAKELYKSQQAPRFVKKKFKQARAAKDKDFFKTAAGRKATKNVTISDDGRMTTNTGTTSETPLISNVIIDGESQTVRPPDIIFNDKGEVIGGEVAILPTPEQKKENAAIDAINKKNKIAEIEELAYYDEENPKPIKGKNFRPWADTEEAYQERLSEWEAKREEVKARYAPLEIPYPEKVVDVDAERAKKLYFETWGEKPESLLEGKVAGFKRDDRRGQKEEVVVQPPDEGKTLLKKQVNGNTNQTKYIYSDGTEEIVEGI